MTVTTIGETCHAKAPRCLVWTSRTIAAIFLVSALIFIWSHHPLPAMPRSPIVSSPNQTIESANIIAARVASADAITSMVAMLVTLAVGLTAILGFGIKDGFGQNHYMAAGSVILVSLFVYFLVRVMIYAYDTYATIAVQMKNGQLILTLLEESLVLQARSLIYAAILCVLILIFRFAQANK